MSTDESAHFRSKKWIGALRNYAQGLLAWLSADLSRLSGTGLELANAERLTLMVQETDREAERQASWRGRGRDGTEVAYGPKRASIAPPIEDLKMLEDWLANSTEPLLLLAPFGSGKSVLLATFACQLAEAVVRWCDNPGDEPLPPVPLPVRLRAWDWYAREKFRAYVCGRSLDVLDLSDEPVLTADDLRRLATAGKLLPLYDGFDELADVRDGRRKALEGMVRLKTRFVLSTRPGHGAEARFEDKQTYSLRELTVADAERFICQRLEIAAGEDQHTALVAYRQAQPHINEMFRRPLFLNAWYAEYSENPNDPPNTLAKLMDVVLRKVFDDRVLGNESGRPVRSADKLLLSCHVLGAVLAAYAEQGFGQVCNLLPGETRDALVGAECFADDDEIAEWHALAVRCGLLIPAGADHYTFKIPVVEYLIGSYYAWLVRPSSEASDDAKDKRRGQRFLCKFRQGFWWREFDDIWLYAFDQLWRGSPAQVDMAYDIVVWLLDYSKRCMDAGQYAGEVLPEQTDEDRLPFTCHSFAIRVLLPVGPVSVAVNRRVEKLLSDGIKQILEELLRNWRDRPNANDYLEPLAERRPVELVQYLKPLLADKSHKDLWPRVAGAIRTGLEHLEPVRVKEVVEETLLPCLSKAEYEQAWAEIVDALDAGLSSIRPAYVKEVVEGTLLPCLSKAEYERAWGHIANVIGNRLSRLEPAYVKEVLEQTLLPSLAKAEYSLARAGIANAVGKGLCRLEPAYVKEILDQTLLTYLADADYKQDWASIAGAIGNGLSRLDPAYVKEVMDESLLPRLVNAEYEIASPGINYAIENGLNRMESAHVKEVLDTSLLPCLANSVTTIDNAIIAGFNRMLPGYLKEVLDQFLLPCLANAKYKGNIARVIGSGLTRMESAHVKEVIGASLLPLMANADFEEDWVYITAAVHMGLCRLEPAYVKELVVKSFLPWLASADYEIAWIGITWLIRDGLLYLEPAYVKEVVNQTLMKYLANTRYELLWDEIADAIAANGQVVSGQQAQFLDQFLATRPYYGMTLVSAAPKLRWFVRRIGDDLVPKRIVYGVCERNSPELLFDPELQAAPESITLLCKSVAAPAVSARTESTEDRTVGTNTTQEKVTNWLNSIAVDWLPILQLFWCVGYLEQESLMQCGIAMGYRRLEELLGKLENKNKQLASLSFGQTHLRQTLTVKLPDLFDSESFPKEIWAADEQDSPFRILGKQGDMTVSKWTPRARRAWQLLDTLFPLAKTLITF